MYLKNNNNSQMAGERKGDTKSSVKGLDVSIGGDALSYYKPIDDKTDRLVKLLLSEDTGPKLNLTFDVGDMKLRVYGQPTIMSKYSSLILSLAHTLSFKEEMLLGTGVSLKYPAAFLNVWLYINGITTSIVPRNVSEETDETIVGMWQWIKYLGVDILNKPNYEWIRYLVSAISSEKNIMTMDERKDICNRLKTSLKQVPVRELEELEGIFGYLSGICDEPIVAGQYFVQDIDVWKDEKIIARIRGSRDFGKGIAYAVPFVAGRYQALIDNTSIFNNLTLNIGPNRKEEDIKRFIYRINDSSRALDKDTYVIAKTNNSDFWGILPRDMVKGIQYFYDLTEGEGLQILSTEDITDRILAYMREKRK